MGQALRNCQNKKEVNNFFFKYFKEKKLLSFLEVDYKVITFSNKQTHVKLRRIVGKSLDELDTKQEKIDTKLIFYANHYLCSTYPTIIIHSPSNDTESQFWL